MENVKHKIIAFWLTHVFLRRIGKRYPEYFYKWICELTIQQMMDASDILKDIAKADSAMSKACYYDSMRGGSDDRKY